MKNVKRFVNFRPLLWIFLTFIGAVYAVIKAFCGYFIPLGVFGGLFFVVSVLFIISLVKKNFLTTFFERFGIHNFKIFFIIVLISTIIASSSSAISFTIANNRPFENGTYTISAKVKEFTLKDDDITILLSNVKINEKTTNFNIMGYAENIEISVGDDIKFVGYLAKRNLVNSDGTINTSILKTNTKYYCYIDANALQLTSGNADLISKLKDKTKNILNDNLSDENAGFAYSVVMGDKSMLSDEYYSMFKNAGLAHILAVSGLHIGFLVALLELILKALKVKGKVRFFAILTVLLIYNVICNFAPSVFRASVMSLCLMLGLLLGERNDRFSNISLAGIIVLMSQPIYLFDVGFLLSFSSVIGILFFANIIQKLLMKIKFPKIIAESIAVTFSATIGTIPFICKYFGEFAPISLVSNIVVLPLFSLMFALLILIILPNLLINLSFLFKFCEFFINIVTNLSFLFSKFGVIKTINFDAVSIFTYYFICFFLSPFVMLKSNSKLICTMGLIVCLTSILSITNLPQTKSFASITATKGTSNSVVLTTSTSKNILANVEPGYYRFMATKSMLKDLNVHQIDVLLLFNYKQTAQNNVTEIVNLYNVQNVYIFGKCDNTTKIGLVNNLYQVKQVMFFEDTIFEFENLHIDLQYFNNEIKFIKYKFDNLNVLQILKSTTQTEINTAKSFVENEYFDYLICDIIYDRYFNIKSNCYVARKTNLNESHNLMHLLDRSILWTMKKNYDTI